MTKYGCKFYCNLVLAVSVAVTAIFLPLNSFIAEAATNAQITATVAVGVCGNDVVEFGEDCDRSSLDGQTCASLGYDGGSLFCDVGCNFDTAQCINLEPEIETGGVVFSGKSYPLSVIRILKDGQIAATTAAGLNGDFSTTLSNLTTGEYIFSVYAYDANGEKSKTLDYQRTIVKDEISDVGSIIIPPTLKANAGNIDQEENITFSG